MGKGGPGSQWGHHGHLGSHSWPWEKKQQDDKKRKKDKKKKRDHSSSSLSSMDSEKQLEIAERILWKKDPEYRNHVRSQESKARDEKYERQGKILADALAPELQALRNAAAAWAPPSGAASAASADPPAARSGGDNLSMLQRQLVEAELDHKVSLPSGTFEDFFKAVESKWAQRDVVKRVDAFIKRTGGPGMKVPRSKEDRLKLMFEKIKTMGA